KDTMLATVSLDGTAKIWDVASGHEFRTLKLDSDDPKRAFSAAFSPDSQLLAVGYGDRFVTLADGQRIESDSGRGLVVLCDTATGQAVRRLDWHRYHVSGVAFIRERKELISADDHDNIAVSAVS